VHPRRPGPVALVDTTKQLLAASTGARLPVVVIAQRLGCSVFHLCRTFRRIEGTTISAYRASLRVQLVMRHLQLRPGADLTEVALEYGYCSHSHLTASFRKAVGMTPSAYAALVSGPARMRASAALCGGCNR
jgi:AraC family transcriptional regulator